MTPQKAKGYIELNGPYWRMVKSVPGAGWREVGRWMGKDSQLSENDLEEGLRHFEKVCELMEGDKSRFNLFCKAKPQTQEKFEHGPFGFFIPVENTAEPGGSAEPPAIIHPQQGISGLAGINPMEVLHLQRETMLSGIADQRTLMQAEEALYREYRQKFDELAEKKQDFNLKQKLLDRDKRDWEAWKKEEKERLRELEETFTRRSSIVQNGTSKALEELLGLWANGGSGLKGLSGREEEEAQAEPCSHWDIVEPLFQHVYEEMKPLDIKYLAALNQVIRKHVGTLKAKISAQGPGNEPGRPDQPDGTDPPREEGFYPD